MSWIKNQHKVELHRHLEGSIPFHTLWELQNEGILPTNFASLAELTQRVSLTKPVKNLQEALLCFEIFQKSFANPECVKRITHDVLEQCAQQNVKLLELRFSPHFMAEKFSLDWDEVMASILLAKRDFLQRHADFRLGLIVIVSRCYGPSSGLKTAEFARRWRDHICGFDFADDEIKFPHEDFSDTVKKVQALDLPITVHTGEGTGPEFIKKSLEIHKPQRLGHAVSLQSEPKLMEYCAHHNICVESCPTSNIITSCVTTYAEHPIRTYLKEGVPVCLNTDDPTVLACELNDEWQRAMDLIGLTQRDLLTLNENAKRFSFLS